MTQLQKIREYVEAELDAGRKFPTRPQIAKSLGLRHDHDFGGRVTFELQKIKAGRGIATAQDLMALVRKAPTYEGTTVVRRQRMIVQELREAGQW